MSDTTRELIFATLKDAVTDLLYYDRVEDEELNTEQIAKAFKDRVVTVEECVDMFESELREQIDEQ